MNIREPWVGLISLETITRLHEEGINKYGGLHGPPDVACVESSLGAAYNAGLYTIPEEEMTPTAVGLVFCGYLLYYLARNHCFTEGNKRVAWTSAMHVLLRLRLTINVAQETAEAFCDDVVKGILPSAAEVVQWIADLLEPVDEDGPLESH